MVMFAKDDEIVKVKPFVIATHGGKFNANNIMAVSLSYRYYDINNKKWSIRVIRTDDRAEWESADVRISVGENYNVMLNDFDHHQENFSVTHGDAWYGYKLPEVVKVGNTNYNPRSIKMATAGLVWENVGVCIVNYWMNILTYLHDFKLTQEDINQIVVDITSSVIIPLDIIENGDIHLVGITSQPTLWSMIKEMNAVNISVHDAITYNNGNYNSFTQAVNLCSMYITTKIKNEIYKYMKFYENETNGNN